MRDKEDLIKLRDAYIDTKKKIDSFGKNRQQFKTVIDLSLWLQDIITESKRVKKQSESIKTKGMRYKVKVSKKLEKLYKEVCLFEATVLDNMKRGIVPASAGRRFIGIVNLLKKTNVETVDSLFRYFDDLLKLNETFNEQRKELKREHAFIVKRIGKIESMLEELDTLNSVAIDTEKVRLYEEYLSELNRLKGMRADYIDSLLSLNIAELIDTIMRDSLVEQGFPELHAQDTEEIYKFLKNDRIISNMNIKQICSMLGYSDEKLRHIYPEVSRFKKMVLLNRVWFERVGDLKRSNFIAPDVDNQAKIAQDDKLRQFYREHVPGAKEVLNNIEKCIQDIPAYKKEYEKYRKYKLEKERLSNYSKRDLEAQRSYYTSMIDILKIEELEDVLKGMPELKEHSNDRTKSQKRTPVATEEAKKEPKKEEEKEKKKGEKKREKNLISRLRSLLRLKF